MIQKNLLAIHDISCVGRCSLTVALPILSATGLHTSVLPTAVLSTHTGGFQGFTYRDLTEDIPKIADHWRSFGVKFDGMYSGFLGSYEQIDQVAALYQEFKQEKGLIIVDPVMADHGALYSVFTPKMVEGMARLCQSADLILPNLTEGALLLKQEYVGEGYDWNYIEKMVRDLSELGPKKVVLTGVSFHQDRLGAMCFDRETNQVDYVENRSVEGHFPGTGDVFASALVSGLMNSFTLQESAQIAVDFTLNSIEKAMKIGLERRFGVAFEPAIPDLIKQLKLGG
ncbi:MAG: pyridoxamine kinase [Eubacteriales bacterium]